MVATLCCVMLVFIHMIIVRMYIHMNCVLYVYWYVYPWLALTSSTPRLTKAIDGDSQSRLKKRICLSKRVRKALALALIGKL